MKIMADPCGSGSRLPLSPLMDIYIYITSIHLYAHKTVVKVALRLRMRGIELEDPRKSEIYCHPA